MGQTETLIEEALIYAKGRGLRINRGGAVFDWCIRDSAYSCHMADYPVSCDAIGAVLLKMGREDLVCNGFQEGWLKIVCDYLNVDSFWIYRFNIGFDSGHQILITKTKDNKEKIEKEEVSRMGLKLANKYANKT